MNASDDTNAKALRINLDPAVYGAFAEIGGGQEVSRWFFRAGGAAGTIAKTISAYDMAVSDAIYGSGERYVSRERVRSMIAHEYGLLVDRLCSTRGSTCTFFAFADTVATRSFKGGNECHGWVGMRFQHAPGEEPSDILLHVALSDPSALQQQQTLGVLGVNLIHSVAYQRDSIPDLLKALLDGLTSDNLGIDVVELSGPAFTPAIDQQTLALAILSQGLATAVVLDESGRLEQPSTVFRKRTLLVHRCSMERDNPQMEQMLDSACHQLVADGITSERVPLRLLELAITQTHSDTHASAPETLRVNHLTRPGCALLLTTIPETFRIATFLRAHSNEPIRFLLGLDSVVTVLRNSFYEGRLDGGLLEGLGKLLSPNTRLYVFPMAPTLLAQRLSLHQVEPGFWAAPDTAILTAEDLTLAAPAGHLLDFLRSAGWVQSVKLPTPPLDS